MLLWLSEVLSHNTWFILNLHFCSGLVYLSCLFLQPLSPISWVLFSWHCTTLILYWWQCGRATPSHVQSVLIHRPFFPILSSCVLVLCNGNRHFCTFLQNIYIPASFSHALYFIINFHSSSVSFPFPPKMHTKHISLHFSRPNGYDYWNYNNHNFVITITSSYIFFIIDSSVSWTNSTDLNHLGVQKSPVSWLF